MTTTNEQLLAAVRRMEAALLDLAFRENQAAVSRTRVATGTLMQALDDWLRTDGAVYFYPNPLPVTKNVPKE